MALTRKFLSALGIEAEKIDEIITAHTDTISGIKDDLNKYKHDAEQVPELEAELEKLKSKKTDDWQKKYEAEHEAFENFKADVNKKEVINNKRNAYKNLLISNNVDEKRLDAILKVTDYGSIELTDDGKLVDEDKLSETIKKEWSGFITSKTEVGTNVDNPPGNNEAMTKEAFDKMSLSEKMTYANAHPAEASAFIKS